MFLDFYACFSYNLPFWNLRMLFSSQYQISSLDQNFFGQILSTVTKKVWYDYNEKNCICKNETKNKTDQFCFLSLFGSTHGFNHYFRQGKTAVFPKFSNTLTLSQSGGANFVHNVGFVSPKKIPDYAPGTAYL